MLNSCRKIVCIGRNYAEHARELGNAVPKGVPLVSSGAVALARAAADATPAPALPEAAVIARRVRRQHRAAQGDERRAPRGRAGRRHRAGRARHCEGRGDGPRQGLLRGDRRHGAGHPGPGQDGELRAGAVLVQWRGRGGAARRSCGGTGYEELRCRRSACRGARRYYRARGAVRPGSGAV